MAHLNHSESFPKSFPKTPVPYKGAAGNFGKGGPVPEFLFSGKTGNFGKQSKGAALDPMSIRNLAGSGAAAVFSHDETEVV